MLYILQPDAEVPPGLLPTVLDAHGVPHRVTRLYQGEPLPDARDVTAVVVLGGRMGARDMGQHPFLGDLRRFLREAADGGAAILGICLGGQLLADTLGGELTSAQRGEKGIHNVRLTPLGCIDPLFHNLPYNFVTYQWHSDSFDIPEDAVLLATAEACRNQAFRFDAKVYGLQFHPEVTDEIVRAWAGEESGHARAFQTASAAYEETGRKIFVNFLRVAGLA